MIEITRRKEFLSISETLGDYLDTFGRRFGLPATYDDLRGFDQSYPLFDRTGQPTHWATVMYERGFQADLWRRRSAASSPTVRI